MHPGWVRNIKDQCERDKVVFFFKQWGNWLPALQFGETDIDPGQLENKFKNAMLDGDRWEYDLDDRDCNDDPENWSCLVGKKRAGRILDGQTYSEFPV